MKHSVHLFAIGIILAATLPSWSQSENSAPTNKPGPGPFSIRISVDHDEAKVGSELTLTVSMANIDSEEHCYVMVRGYAYHNFSAIVSGSSGSQVGSSPKIDRRAKEATSSRRYCLRGGASLSQTMRLDELFDLATPDAYRIQVSRPLTRSGDKVFSNRLTFTITP
jgi:hypothetical protein